MKNALNKTKGKKMTNLFEAKIHDFLRLNDRVLIAVSGGPDSMALLHLLNDIKGRFKLGLYVAHFNHKLRGAHSERDAEFVRREAEKLGITYVLKTMNIKEAARHMSGGLEKVARDERYAFFIETAARYGLNKIALAHTNDDNIETMLFRFIKGSGVYGLRGIAPVRKIEFGEFGSKVEALKTRAGISIIRPLIYSSKKSIYEYLKSGGFKFVVDKSNAKNIYDRNKLRNMLIPAIEKTFNPAFKTTLSNTCEIIGNEDDFLNSLVLKLRNKLVTKTTTGVKLSDKIKTLHKALRYRILRMTLYDLFEHKRKISYPMIADIDSKIHSGKLTGVSLPENYFFTAGKEGMYIAKAAASGSAYEEAVVRDFPEKAKAGIYSAHFRFEKTSLKNKPDFSSPDRAYMDLAAVKFPLKLRGRKEGDRFIPYGSDKEQRLKNFINTAKLKEPVIVLEDAEKIVWIAGARVDERVKVTSKTKMALKVTLLR